MKLACDVHTHTISSRHAYSTIQENVEAAKARGLELLGSADHFSPMIAGGCDLRDFQHFLNVSVWPRVWDGVVVLRGCEADIVDLEGHLFGWDVPVERAINEDRFRDGRTHALKDLVFRDLDYVVASVHARGFCAEATRAQATEMYIGALHDPKTAILGHMGRSGVPFEAAPVLEEAKRLGKMVELNEYSFSMPSERVHLSCRDLALACAEMGVMVAVSTDAHIAPRIGEFRKTDELLEEIGFPEELVATRSADAFLDALRNAGVADVAREG